MCSTHQHPDSHANAHEPHPSDLTFRVDDMTCGHCAGTIKKAIETSMPGTQVNADPGSKLVSVTGAENFARLQEIVSQAGYTASPVQA